MWLIAIDSASIVKRAKERFHSSESATGDQMRRSTALSLTFAAAKSFFGTLYNTSAINGSSPTYELTT